MQRHATDVISLVLGIIFTGLTVVWLLDLNGTVDRDNAWYVGPAVLIAAGLAGLAASLRPPGRDTDERP